MKILAFILINLMWCIPGSLHKEACQLKAERKAAKNVCKQYGIKF